MQSGNFLIGKQGLSVAGFNEYFLPELKKRKCEVRDIVSLGDPQGVLVSIAGENLEDAVKESVKTSYDQVSKVEYKENASAYNFQLGIFETIGVYCNKDSASMNFPLIAQKYLCISAEESIDSIKERLEELANSKIADFAG